MNKIILILLTVLIISIITIENTNAENIVNSNLIILEHIILHDSYGDDSELYKVRDNIDNTTCYIANSYTIRGVGTSMQCYKD